MCLSLNTYVNKYLNLWFVVIVCLGMGFRLSLLVVKSPHLCIGVLFGRALKRTWFKLRSCSNSDLPFEAKIFLYLFLKKSFQTTPHALSHPHTTTNACTNHEGPRHVYPTSSFNRQPTYIRPRYGQWSPSISDGVSSYYVSILFLNAFRSLFL